MEGKYHPALDYVTRYCSSVTMYTHFTADKVSVNTLHTHICSLKEKKSKKALHTLKHFFLHCVG